jgi:hypothetical protein
MTGINLTKTLGLDWNLILNVAVGTVFGFILTCCLLQVLTELVNDLKGR